MTRRPNHSNPADACCCCGKLLPTPQDHEKPGKGQLGVWQPDSHDPPQWICTDCKTQLELDAKRNS
jgi:hypothetical protein